MSLRLHSPNTAHSPVTTTLKHHRSAFGRAAQNLEGTWLLEGSCVAREHQDYFAKLQAFELAFSEVVAALRDLLPGTPCCDGCADADDEWERFDAERPIGILSPEARVETAEIEAQANGWYSYTPTPHPVAVGSCDLAVLAGNWDCDDRRGA